MMIYILITHVNMNICIRNPHTREWTSSSVGRNGGVVDAGGVHDAPQLEYRVALLADDLVAHRHLKLELLAAHRLLSFLF